MHCVKTEKTGRVEVPTLRFVPIDTKVNNIVNCTNSPIVVDVSIQTRADSVGYRVYWTVFKAKKDDIPVAWPAF